MARIKGITVMLVTKQEAGRDPFGGVIYKDIEIPIHNVLVAPVSSEDIVNQLNLTGRRAAYTLALPKDDDHRWEEAEVRFFGKKFKVIGVPVGGIDEMIPLSWNKKVTVERYE